jgi:gliding motility-associated-like protein
MWWEYIHGELTTLLEAGKIYRFSMEISLAEYSDLMISEMGAFFSDTPISSPNTAALNLIPQCVFTDINYFSDTENWMHLETYYQATGTEKYITIGNFRDNLTTDTLRRYNLEPLNPNPKASYFYIDNVQLIDYTWTLDPTNVFSPNGDGVNDLWTLPYSDQKQPKKVTIMNRWGNLIKEGDLNGFSWDGKTEDGVDCAAGNYFFKISNTNIAGFIQLIR